MTIEVTLNEICRVKTPEKEREQEQEHPKKQVSDKQEQLHNNMNLKRINEKNEDTKKNNPRKHSICLILKAVRLFRLWCFPRDIAVPNIVEPTWICHFPLQHPPSQHL